MATLDEEGALPGGVADLGAGALGSLDRREPGRDVPPGLLAPGAAPGDQVALDHGVGEAPRRAQVVRPAYEPQEPDRNTVLRGQPPATADPLTQIQRAVADERLRDPSATHKEIAARVGASPGGVGSALSRPLVKIYLSQHLDAAGASVEAAARVVADGMKAHLPQTDRDTGEVSESDVPDHAERRQNARLTLEGHGALEEVGTQVNIYQSMTDEQLAAVATGQAKMGDFIDMRPGP